MAKERFVEVYNQGIVNVARIIVDTETGVNYLLGSHNKANGTGLTVLVDRDGKPIGTPAEERTSGTAWGRYGAGITLEG